MRFHARTLPHPAGDVNRLSAARQEDYGARMEPDRNMQDKAIKDLARLRREGDALGGLFGRAGLHFGAADAPAGDRIEVWGRRIGRMLSAVAFLALCVYLYLSHVR